MCPASCGNQTLSPESFDEDAEATRLWIQPYSDALLGHPLSVDVWKREQIDLRLGVTRGSLRIGNENQALQVSL
jgi:putative protease